jgi:protein-S-isoprenylcysteine O-methyltransferase Ste14
MNGWVVAAWWLVQVTVLAWLAAEIVLQRRQYRQGGKATVTEWRSLGVITVSIIVGNVLARLALRHLPPFALGIPLGARLAVALPVSWAGIGFRLWSIRTLGRFFRGVVHVQAGHEVIQHGPYRLLRHPSYAGALLAVLGFSIIFDNAVSIVAFVGCALVGILYRIRVEERVLRAQLGQAYGDYAARTRRLVPGLW